jgi:hypothetical protein
VVFGPQPLSGRGPPGANAAAVPRTERERRSQNRDEHGRPSVVRFIKLEVIDLACPPGVDIMICRASSTTDIRA